MIFSDEGFDSVDGREFTGKIQCGAPYGDIEARILLSDGFPVDLPEVYVARTDLSRSIPHHEESGKLCLFPETGTLIDTERPDKVIRETLETAKKTLIDGLGGTNDSDFAEEFTAYWKGKERFRSIADAFGPSRQIVGIRVAANGGFYQLIADSDASARSFAQKLGHHLKGADPCFFIRFKSWFIPPKFGEQITNAKFLEIVQTHGENDAKDALLNWLSNRSLPRTCLLSIPTNRDDQRTLVALRLERPNLSNQTLPRIRKVEGAKQLLSFGEMENTRISISRLDNDFVVGRGGSKTQLAKKIVVLVGAGSLGSRLAEKLASVGVGTLRIIDPDDFKEENLGRHILGIDSLGVNKAKAVAGLLDRRFPLQTHLEKASTIDDVLNFSPEFLEGDLLIFSIGDETVQINFDSRLPKATKRIHVWVEPLGLGGHLISKLSEDNGCYNCIFKRGSGIGLYNTLAFCKPGQLLLRTHSGCAGQFTPFSALDADKAASEAATYAVQVLTGHDRNEAVSWLTRTKDFVHDGFEVTQRAGTFSDGERKIIDDFYNPDCAYCGT